MKLEGGGHTVAQYEYDGAKRRTVKKTYTAGTLSETRHFYYTEPSQWQVIEERVDSSTDPNRHFVWGLRYVDDLVLRDRDTNDDGTLDERLYGLQDANWNVTCICTPVGSSQERYTYHAYGTHAVYDVTFEPRGTSDYNWNVLFAGYNYDLETRLYAIRNRIYIASTGQWLQRDPAAHSSTANLYEYADSSPLLYVDPLGLHPVAAAGVVIAGLTLLEWCLLLLGIALAVCLVIPGCVDALYDAIANALRKLWQGIGRVWDWIKEKCRRAFELCYCVCYDDAGVRDMTRMPRRYA